MQIGFLFNHYETHQVPHSAPIAFELSRQYPELNVIIACSTRQECDMARAISRQFPGHRCTFRILKTAWYHPILDRLNARKSFKRKKWILSENLDFFRGLDALVAPEKNCLRLKTVHGLDKLKMIHTRHGVGDAAAAFDERCEAFDFMLLPGQKYVDRLKSSGRLHTDRYAVVGYPKFDVAPALQDTERKPFANDNPIVVYNPHFDQNLSSWQSMGLKILDFFAENKDYNLIFAPHVVLFKRARRHGASLPKRYKKYPNILIDKGSSASNVMTYTMAADIYLGDVSSQVYEFLLRPRPCIFLNAHKVNWVNDPNYFNWTLGQVIDDVDTGLSKALDRAGPCHPFFAEQQRRAFSKAFHVEPDSTAAQRGARAIAGFLLGEEDQKESMSNCLERAVS